MAPTSAQNTRYTLLLNVSSTPKRGSSCTAFIPLVKLSQPLGTTELLVSSLLDFSSVLISLSFLAKLRAFLFPN
jgi:hypothetical protein